MKPLIFATIAVIASALFAMFMYWLPYKYGAKGGKIAFSIILSIAWLASYYMAKNNCK